MNKNNLSTIFLNRVGQKFSQKNMIKNNKKLFHDLDKKNVDNISVIIPFYNEEKVILNTLNKITNIGIKGEILLINNKCTDDSTEIVENFIKNFYDKHLTIRHLFCSELGKGNALITGFKNVKYDTILMTDADDEFEINELPDFIEKYKQLDDKYIEIVALRKPAVISSLLQKELYSICYKILLNDTFSLSGTRMFPTEVIKQLLNHNLITEKKFGIELNISRSLHYYGESYYHPITYTRRNEEKGKKLVNANLLEFKIDSIKFLLREFFKPSPIINSKSFKTTSLKNIHIGLIIDGNRRYSKKNNLKKKNQHLLGFNKVVEINNYFKNKENIKYVTIYTLAENNMKRSSEEINNIFTLFSNLTRNYKKNQDNVQLNIISTNTLNFNKELISNIEAINNISKTIENPDLYVNVLWNYSARKDIELASEKMCLENNKKKFRDYLQTGKFPDIDLLIRTGGNCRMSDFPLYESAYSELFFLDKYLPEISIKDLDDILEKYNGIQQNFGR